MNLTMLSPGKEIFNGAITSVKVPGINGQFEILKDHAAIVSALSSGEVRIIDQKGERTAYNITQGFVEVLENEVSILVHSLQKEDA